jgi:16S rRNA (cytidine1402-2'-O)-methyltransferase
MLYLIPTPIGNLEDITLRAINTLKEVDEIFAEDTRVALRLLKHLNIDKKVMAYHAMNEHKALNGVLNLLKTGKKLAYISDAGTPAISDPGYLLVKLCLENNFKVECLPGPAAFVPALVESGLPTHSFVFEGFLPHKKGRKTKLEQLKEEPRTIIFYESPHRLLKTLSELAEHFGTDRKIAVCRELTKMFHEVHRNTLANALQYFSEKGVKGEFVLVIEGKPDEKKSKVKTVESPI